ECLAWLDVVTPSIPSASYKFRIEWLRGGCVCDIASEKNSDTDVRDKVYLAPALVQTELLSRHCFTPLYQGRHCRIREQ
ncbi:hypothetical protein BS47DRAFT_1295318, partial [Hydnum rufescens UP504]